jgi:hypothetical protein
VRRALEKVKKLEQKRRERGEEKEPRVSTTDPDAQVMKMSDGGFRPAFNVQFATDTASQVIVGVSVTTSGNDQGQLLPMIEQLEDRLGLAPTDVLVDGGYVNRHDFDELAGRTTIYAPVPKPKDPTIDPHQPRPSDSDTVAEWRRRMKSKKAKEIYKERAATAECVNAHARNRGLWRFLVRGVEKTTAVAFLHAIAQNMCRTMAFGLLSQSDA